MKPITKQIRSERHKRAESMQEEYNKLSLQQKLDKLPIDGAKKQRAKLAKLLAKEALDKLGIKQT